MKIRISKRSVDAVVPPTTGETVLWDTELRGFGVRVAASGRRTYFVRKRTKAGRQVRVRLGVHGEVTADQARTAAIRELGRIADGADPADARIQARAEEQRRRQILTIAGLADKYLIEHAQVHCRPRTIAEYRGLIERHIKPQLGAIKVPDLCQADAAALHHKLAATPYEANRTIAVLSQMLNCAVDIWELRPANPITRKLPRYHEEKRQRFLLPAELIRLGQALAQHPHRISANAIRLLLLTGARSGEVFGMRWEQVDATPGYWTKPSSLTKQRTEHRVPLSPGARQLIENMRAFRKPGDVYVFPGQGPQEHLTTIKKAWASVCRAAEITNTRLHDLRHTYASILASAGMSLPIIGSLLGHTQPQTTQRYAHLSDSPLQDATNRVDALVASLAEGGEAAEVTLLHRR